MSSGALADGTIVGVVLAFRLVVPLFIPRWTLPALLASLVIDGLDGGIFEAYTNVDMDWYQSYDKALDIYYLALTYLAVRRNWPGRFSLRLAAGLWYYRLVGVLAFELTGARWLLLVFPNTFEYFVIAIEVVRTRWNPTRLTRRALIATAATIWIVVKLPQEWWIHVAQLDFTDEFARVVLGVEPGDGLGAGFANRPWVAVALVALVAALALGLRWLWPRLPAPDWALTFDADRVASMIGWVPGTARTTASPTWRPVLWNRRLGEKILLTGLVSVIMFEVYPGPEGSPMEVFVVVALVVIANAAISVARARAGRPRRSAPAAWGAALLVNGSALLLFTALVGGRTGVLSWADAVFFTYLITLIVGLYDGYTERRRSRELTLLVA